MWRQPTSVGACTRHLNSQPGITTNQRTQERSGTKTRPPHSQFSTNNNHATAAPFPRRHRSPAGWPQRQPRTLDASCMPASRSRPLAPSLLGGGALVEVERVALGVVAEPRLPPPRRPSAAAAALLLAMISCATTFHRSFALAERSSCAMRLISSPSPLALSALYSSRRADDARDSDRPKHPKLCGMNSSSLHAIAAAAGVWCTRLAMGMQEEDRRRSGYRTQGQWVEAGRDQWWRRRSVIC
ncbi:hypothetical protein D1007_11259 [Hordeum vulgare]|nr:hypothetical protein D1007_11259 [Hordeum vulgare]